MKHFNRKGTLLIIILVVLGAGALIYAFLHHRSSTRVLTLYGNIDIRQVLVAFYDTGRIDKMHVQEGDRVSKGKLLAELDPVRLLEAVVKSEEQVLAQEAILKNAEINLARYRNLIKEGAITQQTLDDTITAAVIAHHTLEANRAALAIAKQELIDSKLYAPHDGIIQSRILEPGDMITPENPVFSLALDNPLWARAYIPETSLGQIQQGATAWITTDSYPGKRFRGWIGFISPTAEFTPKNVETPDLRTALMYQVRIYACNATYQLRLGMPVTIEIPLKNNNPAQNACSEDQDLRKTMHNKAKIDEHTGAYLYPSEMKMRILTAPGRPLYAFCSIEKPQRTMSTASIFLNHKMQNRPTRDCQLFAPSSPMGIKVCEDCEEILTKLGAFFVSPAGETS